VIFVSHQVSNFSAISWRENGILSRDDDDIRFVPDQTVNTLSLNFSHDSASSLKQQLVGRHVTPLEHILILSQLFALSPKCHMLRGEGRSNIYQFYNLWSY
jgi:hypothetical protein